MKKLLLSSALVVAFGLSLTSCRDTDKKSEEKVIIIEKEAEKGDGALEKAGRAIDNAAKEVKEAGKAVDSAAKEVVGDDN